METERSNGGEGSASIGLSLELGCGSGYTLAANVLEILWVHMSFAAEAIMCKYMEAGLPVPHQRGKPRGKVLLALWMAFTVVSINSSPPFLKCIWIGSRARDVYRRTDGKKWRCRQKAVPDHKYCERHIRRGKHRSRKLVEACQAGNPATASTNLSISLPVDSSSNSYSRPKSILQLQ